MTNNFFCAYSNLNIGASPIKYVNAEADRLNVTIFYGTGSKIDAPAGNPSGRVSLLMGEVDQMMSSSSRAI